MNQIIFDNIIFSLQRAGGISVVWQELIQHLISEGIDGYNCLEYEDAECNIFRKKIDIPKSNILPLSRPLIINRYLSPKIKTDYPAIFHSSYYRTVKKPIVKNVTTVHDFTYEYIYSGLHRHLHSWQKNKAIIESDIIACISQNTANDLLKFCPSIDKKRIRIVYNGVSREYYPLVPNHREALKDSVLFVGIRDAYKNFKFTVDAISSTKYRLLICGSPLSDDETIYLNTKIGKKRYDYLGRVSNQELNSLYNSVYCLAYPSSYEGFGIPVLEAQRAKCPVIALNSSSIPEVMGTKDFLMKDLSISEFQDKLKIIENEKIRNSILEEGYEYSQKFSWDKMASDYYNIYKELSF